MLPHPDRCMQPAGVMHPVQPITRSPALYPARCSLPDPSERVAAIEAWTTLAAASVNWHEDGADEVAAVLCGRGVGVEAGLRHAEAV
jgi:hypothetical protein